VVVSLVSCEMFNPSSHFISKLEPADNLETQRGATPDAYNGQAFLVAISICGHSYFGNISDEYFISYILFTY